MSRLGDDVLRNWGIRHVHKAYVKSGYTGVFKTFIGSLCRAYKPWALRFGGFCFCWLIGR